MYHWAETRALTNRERARLQTFPDDYAFVGGIPDVRRQIGMAVPPRAAALVIGSLIAAMQGKTLESTIPPNVETVRESRQGNLFGDSLAA